MTLPAGLKECSVSMARDCTDMDGVLVCISPCAYTLTLPVYNSQCTRHDFNLRLQHLRIKVRIRPARS